MNRMDARDRNKDYTGAMSDLDLYLKLSPKTYSLFYEKGRIQLELKDTLSAENTFNQFIQKDSANCLGWSARAILRMEKNDKDGALKDYNGAIKRNSTYEGDYINRGIINVEKKNYNQALKDYINNNLNYPKEEKAKGIQGTVIVDFVVNTKGEVTKAKIVHSASPSFDAEALRVVTQMKTWIPGKQKGVPVNVEFTVPIKFKIK